MTTSARSDSPVPPAPRVPISPLDPRLRRDSRIALYLALAVTAASTWGLSRVSEGPNPRVLADVKNLQKLFDGVDFRSLPEVQLLRDYVAIDTAEPDANEIEGARFLAAHLKAAGLEPHVESVGGRRANVWAFVEGEDPMAIVLSGHIDVEPAASQEGWRFPPFGGAIDGPWIYGRGMYDMKSLAIAQLLAVTDIARSGRKPKRSLLFIQTSAEETGSDTGVRWILRQHPELVARMGLVLTEGGVVEAMSYDQIKYWGIEFAQKRFAKLTFCGSSRERLESLQEYLREFGKLDPYPGVAPPVSTFLAAYSRTRGLGYYQTLLGDPDRTILHRSDFERLTRFMQALFRDELWAFPVEAVASGGFEMKVMAHLLPGADLETLLAAALPDWTRHGVTWSFDPVLGTDSASAVDSSDFRALVAVVEEQLPGVSVGPYFLPWSATDARFYRAAGIPSYGFSPFPLTVTETLQMGKPNERMQLPAFVRGVEIYRQAVRRLAG